MDTSTFKDKEAKNEMDWSFKLEEYRFSFMRYLDTAESYLELAGERDNIAEIENWLKRHKPSDDDMAARAEEFLFRHYNLENSPEGLKRAIRQFRADLDSAILQEQLLWLAFVHTVSEIDNVAEQMAWYAENPNYQHGLILKDALSVKRIHFYRRSLSRFDRKPSLPMALETVFILEHGRFANSIPHSS